MLGIKTKLNWSTKYTDQLPGALEKTEKLVAICKAAEANEYISGPAAKGYVDQALFDEAGIKLTYVDYSGYPEYPQLFDGFVHEVSILDLMFNVGPGATSYLKTF